ncbi:HAD-IIA family hydrolase [Phycicoccus sp. CSK15P-2]|uniref:HAD-IIA family hydrolase n=1 Tax=Phycicoccus sp. CSK15P-2 TaxID=2807627 RepID=UPI00194EA3E5|nr:HAD-IIA family hydrolase [Phycicoccus sp. CSK15P-2]MBM6403700.1 HAD-IIA family hydrolase [Phycicoccus sp. CSK15P-2]
MTSLVDRYAALACDLDGVVYRGPAPVDHAVEALDAVRSPVVYATNNASRRPRDVAAHLGRLGLRCREAEVTTSSEAAAWLLGRTDVHGAVLAVGGPGVGTALAEAGFEVVLPADASDAEVAAVVQGYGPDVTASDLAEAAYAVQSGARWVATNADATLPTDRGVAPGNGSLVAAVARAVGRDPDDIAGKPQPPLYLLTAERLGLSPSGVLAVGDRLDTDIEGAVAAGLDSLLVLTGVDDLDAVLVAPPARRPTFVAPDLRWLHAPGSAVERLTDAVRAVHDAQDQGREDQLERLRAAAGDVMSRAHPG